LTIRAAKSGAFEGFSSSPQRKSDSTRIAAAFFGIEEGTVHGDGMPHDLDKAITVSR
jgi:hypothetical protein